MENTKIAVISDVHSNLEALMAVSQDMLSQKVDIIYCLGDTIGYGPSPKQYLDWVRENAKIIIMGNHEEAVIDMSMGFDSYRLNKYAIAGAEYSFIKLSDKDIDFLKSLPKRERIDEFDLALAHGTFSNPGAWDYVDGDEETSAEVLVSIIPTKICVLGHTHRPFLYDSNSYCFEPENFELKRDRNIINVGSVGQPRDGNWRASYGIFEFKNSQIFFSLRRVEYDIFKTEKLFAGTGLPHLLSNRLFEGR